MDVLNKLLCDFKSMLAKCDQKIRPRVAAVNIENRCCLDLENRKSTTGTKVIKPNNNHTQNEKKEPEEIASNQSETVNIENRCCLDLENRRVKQIESVVAGSSKAELMTSTEGQSELLNGGDETCARNSDSKYANSSLLRSGSSDGFNFFLAPIKEPRKPRYSEMEIRNVLAKTDPDRCVDVDDCIDALGL